MLIRRAVGFAVLSLLFAARLLRADAVDAQALFEKVQMQVAATVQQAPRFTCMETIERSWYANRRPEKPGCDSGRFPSVSDRNLVRTDRLRLDVAVGSGQEIFSWHGEKRFQTEEIDKIVSAGPISSGTYFSFLSSIFLGGVAKVFFRDLQLSDRKQVAVFVYSVPIAKSKFETHTEFGAGVMGYHGEFQVDAVTGRLQKLAVITDEMPNLASICNSKLEVRFGETVLDGTPFQLPTEVVMEIVTANRQHTKTTTRYGQCHQFLGESIIRFDAPAAVPVQRYAVAIAPRLPPNLPLDIRIVSTLSAASAWAGDPVEGELVHDIVGKDGIRIAPKAALVHGRLLRIESWISPKKFYTATVQFDELQLPGANCPLDLTSVREPVVSDAKQIAVRQRLEVENPPLSNDASACRFRLKEDQATLRGTVTHWRTK